VPGVLPFRATAPPTIRPEGSMNATDLCYAPATELLTLIREKRLSPVEFAERFSSASSV
jgi:hypothetical protein